MPNKILFVLPCNELSGSVISAVTLKEHLESTGHYEVDVCAPKGKYIQPDLIIPECRKNPAILLNAYARISKAYSKYHCIVYFTVRFGLLSPLFKSNEILYIHEVDIGKGFIQKAVIKIVNSFNKRLWVVNPLMRSVYPNGICLPNIFHKETSKSNSIRSNDFLMIANFKRDKGIYVLRELALLNPEKSFILLTNKDLADNDELEKYISDCPNNFKVILDQKEKEPLLQSSLYLLNLSLLEETFGLTLLEALSYDVIPMSFENIGASYCLSSEALFLNRDDTNCSLMKIVEKVENNRREYLGELKNYSDKHFSPEFVVSKFRDLIE
ncbi:hypothetical protein ABS858_16730 [Vibrio neptunius]|uniref:hypothetical protein n=1 Tax=Vibrio neptunius TaxID=170651 RepID=UPI0033147DCE